MAWHLRGTILFRLGPLEAGLHNIQKTVDVNPGFTVARFRFGPICVYQQKYEEARLSFLRRDSQVQRLRRREPHDAVHKSPPA